MNNLLAEDDSFCNQEFLENLHKIESKYCEIVDDKSAIIDTENSIKSSSLSKSSVPTSPSSNDGTNLRQQTLIPDNSLNATHNTRVDILSTCKNRSKILTRSSIKGYPVTNAEDDKIVKDFENESGEPKSKVLNINSKSHDSMTCISERVLNKDKSSSSFNTLDLPNSFPRSSSYTNKKTKNFVSENNEMNLSSNKSKKDSFNTDSPVFIVGNVWKNNKRIITFRRKDECIKKSINADLHRESRPLYNDKISNNFLSNCENLLKNSKLYTNEVTSGRDASCIVDNKEKQNDLLDHLSMHEMPSKLYKSCREALKGQAYEPEANVSDIGGSGTNLRNVFHIKRNEGNSQGVETDSPEIVVKREIANDVSFDEKPSYERHSTQQETSQIDTQNVTSSFVSSQEKKCLSNWGLPEGVCSMYKEKGIKEMFSWQIECLSLPNVLDGRNLIYSAPTSAGKTLVAEIILLKNVLERKKKGIFILPFVSVAREKTFNLQQLFGIAGIRVEGFMGNQSPPGGFQKTDIAICTIEKANNIINRLIESKKVQDLGIVVVDELHMIGDPHRGYLLELLLTKLQYVCRTSKENWSVQIVGMSATLPNLHVLSEWQSAALYTTSFRPIPLLQMVKIGSNLYNEDLTLIKCLSQDGMKVENDSDNLIQLCLETILEGFSVLVFCPTKAWCEKIALSLASSFFSIGKDLSTYPDHMITGIRNRLNGDALKQVIEALRSCPAGLDSVLERSLAFGTAFHHAGLTFDERDIIEGAFRAGFIPVLVATSTLSSGVNLPARRVIIRSPSSGGRLLDPLVYRQMVGRAGRKGQDTQGESILMCTENERNKAQTLMESNLPPIQSCLQKFSTVSSSLKRAILEVVVSGAARTKEDIELYWNCTLLSTSLRYNTNSGNVGRSHQSAVDEVLQFLIENELARCQNVDENEAFVPSQLGCAILASGLSPVEGLQVFSELDKARQSFVLTNELHVVYQVTPVYVSGTWPNLNWFRFLEIWEKLSPGMKKVGQLVGVQEGFIVRAIQGTVNEKIQKQRSLLAIHQRFYAALALHDLVQEMTLKNVVTKYSATKGLLQALQQSASTFAGMVTVFCNRLGWHNMELLISQFQNRLHFGVQRDLCDLVRISILNGARARKLHEAGLETVTLVAHSNSHTIENILMNSGPFQSSKNESKTVDDFILGADGTPISVAEASKLIVQEARLLVQKEFGLDNINWSQSSGTSSSSESHKKQMTGISASASTPKVKDSFISDLVSSVSISTKELSKLENSTGQIVENELLNDSINGSSTTVVNPASSSSFQKRQSSDTSKRDSFDMFDSPSLTEELEESEVNGEERGTVSLSKPQIEVGPYAANSRDEEFVQSNFGSNIVKKVHKSKSGMDVMGTEKDRLPEVSHHTKLKEPKNVSELLNCNGLRMESKERSLRSGKSGKTVCGQNSRELGNDVGVNLPDLNLANKTLFEKKQGKFITLESTANVHSSENMSINDRHPPLYSTPLTSNSAKNFQKNILENTPIIPQYNLKVTDQDCSTLGEADCLSDSRREELLNSFAENECSFSKIGNGSKDRRLNECSGLRNLSDDKVAFGSLQSKAVKPNNFDLNGSLSRIEKLPSLSTDKNLPKTPMYSACSEELDSNIFLSDSESSVNNTSDILDRQLYGDTSKLLEKDHFNEGEKKQSKTILNEKLSLDDNEYDEEDGSLFITESGILSASRVSVDEDISAFETSVLGDNKSRDSSNNRLSFLNYAIDTENILIADLEDVEKSLENEFKYSLCSENSFIRRDARFSRGRESNTNSKNVSVNRTSSPLASNDFSTIILTPGIEAAIEGRCQDKGTKDSNQAEKSHITSFSLSANNQETPQRSHSEILSGIAPSSAENSSTVSSNNAILMDSKGKRKLPDSSKEEDEKGILNFLSSKRTKTIENRMDVTYTVNVDYSSSETLILEAKETSHSSMDKENKLEKDFQSNQVKMTNTLNKSSSKYNEELIKHSVDDFVKEQTSNNFILFDHSVPVQVMNVSNDLQLFNAFCQEWKTKKKWSLNIFCEQSSESQTNENKIGSKIVRSSQSRRKACKTGKSSSGIPVDRSNLIISGVLLFWGGSTVYFVDFKERIRESENVDKEKPGHVSLSYKQNCVREVLNSQQELPPTCIIWNMKKIINLIFRAGFKISNINLEDPKVAAWLLDPEIEEMSLMMLVLHYAPELSHLLGKQIKNTVNDVFDATVPQAKSTCKFQQIEIVESTSFHNAVTQCIVAYYLISRLKKKLEENMLTSVFSEVEMPILSLLCQMELNGLGFSKAECRRLNILLEETLKLLEIEAFRISGRSFSISSPDEVAKIFYDELKLPDINSKNRSGNPRSTCKEVLQKLRFVHPLPDIILDWRRIKSALTKVLRPLSREAVLCRSLNEVRVFPMSYTFTATGRVSFHEPNVQFIPKDFEVKIPLDGLKKTPKHKSNDTLVMRQLNSMLGTLPYATSQTISLRSIIVGTKDRVLLAADYSQLELRILAHYSQDANLCSALRNGKDLFKLIASKIHSLPEDEVTSVMRQDAKQICYGIIYGMGDKTLAGELKLDEESANFFMTTFHSSFPAVKGFIQKVVQAAKEVGYVTTLKGRRRYLPLLRSKSCIEVGRAERQAVNTTIQGTAADIVKKAMLDIEAELDANFPTASSTSPLNSLEKKGRNHCGAFLILQLHDELIYEVCNDDIIQVAQIVRNGMENAISLTVPLPVNIKIGPSWSTLRTLNL